MRFFPKFSKNQKSPYPKGFPQNHQFLIYDLWVVLPISRSEFKQVNHIVLKIDYCDTPQEGKNPHFPLETAPDLEQQRPRIEFSKKVL